MITAAAASAQRRPKVVPTGPPLRRASRATSPLAGRADRPAGARLGVAGQSISAASALSCCSSSGMRHLPERRSEARESSGETGLDGALGDAQRRCRLLAAELEKVAGGDPQPVLVAQAVDKVEQPARVLRRDRLRLRGWGRIPRAEAPHQPQLQWVPAAGGADAVAGLVGDDFEQPRLRLRPAAERAERPVGLDEAVLGGLLGVSRGPGDHVGSREGNLLVALHDLLIGSRIAALGAREQLGIFLRSALHWNALNTPPAASWFRPVCLPTLWGGGARRAPEGRWSLQPIATKSV